MASQIDISLLTLNAKEVESFMDFVFEQVFNTPELQAMHSIWAGITMQEQIVFANQFGKSGIADTACARPASGAKSTLTQKYWLPVGVGDTFINCQTDVNALFKAYYNKIKTYGEKFDLAGSDQEKFIATMVIEAAKQAINRLIWLGDTAVSEADSDEAGVTAAATVKFYSVLNGFWKQIFTQVLATTLTRVDLSAKNGEVTPTAQLTLADYYAESIFEAMYSSADPRLRGNADAMFLVSGGLYQNYENGLIKKGVSYNVDLMLNGMPVLTYKGKKVVNMETIWDLNLQADFVDNTTNNAYYLPNRVVFTVPSNIPIGTLNENDFNQLESWYDKITRQNYTAYGFTLDAKWLEDYMGVVAY